MIQYFGILMNGFENMRIQPRENRQNKYKEPEMDRAY